MYVKRLNVMKTSPFVLHTYIITYFLGLSDCDILLLSQLWDATYLAIDYDNYHDVITYMHQHCVPTTLYELFTTR